MAVTTITGSVRSLDDSAAEGDEVRFRLERVGYDETAHYMPSDVVTTVLADNTIEPVELWASIAGGRAILVIMPNGYTWRAFIPDDVETISLEELHALYAPIEPEVSPYLQGLIEQAAADATDVAWEDLGSTTNVSLGASLVGYLLNAIGAVGRLLSHKLSERISIYDFIPVAEHAAIYGGTSTYDATLKIQAAIDAANLAGKIVEGRGGRLNISATIIFPKACDFVDCTFVTANPNIVAVQVGTDATAIINKVLRLPNVEHSGYVEGGGWSTWTGVGIKTINLRQCKVDVGLVLGFSVGLWVTSSDLTGNFYNTYFLRDLRFNKINLRLRPTGTSSAANTNDNTFYGGRLSISSFEGIRPSGTRHVELEGIASSAPNGNRFYGQQLEGEPEYQINSIGGVNNLWDWCRYESSSPRVNFTSFTYLAQVRGSVGNKIDGGYQAYSIVYTEDAGSSGNSVSNHRFWRFFGRGGNEGTIVAATATGSGESPIIAVTGAQRNSDDISASLTMYIAEDHTIFKAPGDSVADGRYRTKITHATGDIDRSQGDGILKRKDTYRRSQIVAPGSSTGNIILVNTSGLPYPALLIAGPDTGFEDDARLGFGIALGAKAIKIKEVDDFGYRFWLDPNHARIVFGDGEGDHYIITPTGPAWSVSWQGVATANIANTATEAQVLAALELAWGPLPGAQLLEAGDIVVEDTAGGPPYHIYFGGTLAAQHIPTPVGTAATIAAVVTSIELESQGQLKITDRLWLTGDTLRIATDNAPASAGANGTKGDIRWANGFLYLCVEDDEWQRVALSTW